MANRICLGNRGSSIGLYISKPGFNALTAADLDLLFTSDRQAFQVIQRGSVALPSGSTATISVPNSGFNPVVLMSPRFTSMDVSGPSWDVLYTFEHLSFTSIRLRLTLNGVTGYTGQTSYLVINKPVGN